MYGADKEVYHLPRGMRGKEGGMVPDTFLYFGMSGRSKMGEELERFF